MKNKFIAFLSEGYPFKVSARNNKNELIALMLKEYNYDSYFYSKKVHFNKESQINPFGDNNGIFFRFLNTAKKNSMGASFNALLSEYYVLRKDSSTYQKKILFVSYMPFILFVYYFLIAKLFRFQLILSIMEWHVVIPANSRGIRKLNAFLFDNIVPRVVKKVIPISNYIANEFKFKNSNDIFILPALTDYNKIESINSSETNEKYFLYCGGIGYIEVINFVLESFEILMGIQNNLGIKLILVLHGESGEITKFRKTIAEYKYSDNVMIFSELSYTDLIKQYKSALALLIPLRPTKQDEARFPHKIPEYLASGRPIVTNNWGEVKYYLSNKENSFVVPNYNTRDFATTMNHILENPLEADKIGKAGSRLCMSSFDYKLFSEPLHNFLSSENYENK